MYAQSWWEKQRKVRFKNIRSVDMPPFGAGLYNINPDGQRGFYYASSYSGERSSVSHFFGLHPASFICNGPLTVKAGQYGFGSITFPAIARVRSELALTDGIGLGFGEEWELDEGTFFESLGRFQDTGDTQLALIAPRRKVCDYGPSATYLFDASAATGYLPFADAAVVHESYSEIAVAKTDFSQRFTIEQDSSGDDVLIIPLDGIYSFSHSQSLPSVEKFPKLVFVGRWPPPDYPAVADQTGTVVAGMRQTNGSSSGSVIRPCLGGMSVKVQYSGALPATTFSVTRIGPLPISWLAEWGTYISSGYLVK